MVEGEWLEIGIGSRARRVGTERARYKLNSAGKRAYGSNAGCYCATRGVYPSQVLRYWVRCVVLDLTNFRKPLCQTNDHDIVDLRRVIAVSRLLFLHRSSVGPPFSIACNSFARMFGLVCPQSPQSFAIQSFSDHVSPTARFSSASRESLTYYFACK